MWFPKLAETEKSLITGYYLFNRKKKKERIMGYVDTNIKGIILLYSPTESIDLSLLQNKITYKMTVNFFTQMLLSLTSLFCVQNLYPLSLNIKSKKADVTVPKLCF